MTDMVVLDVGSEPLQPVNSSLDRLAVMAEGEVAVIVTVLPLSSHCEVLSTLPPDGSMANQY